MNNYFAYNLKKIRKENNLSQEQLADELGVSRQAVSKWESGIAYPEMNKIIALCDKFNLNMDDLLSKDIKEVKGEEKSKKKLNSYFYGFLNFITDAINLFSNMNFKSKVKFVFEEISVIIILTLISWIGCHIIEIIFDRVFGFVTSFLSPNISYYINGIFSSVVMTFFVVLSFVVFLHIFKTRYLDYYYKLKTQILDEDINDLSENKEETLKSNKILFKNNENKIIIRDPKHSEYNFMHGLYKVIITIIKSFSVFIGLFLCMVLVCLFSGIIVSFMVYKTGLFFVGLSLAFLSLGIIDIILILLIFNFLFDRENNKKLIIWSFIGSLIAFAISCGLIFVGTLNFNVVKNNEVSLKTETFEVAMEEGLFYRRRYEKGVECIEKYIESDIDNIKIECSINELFNVQLYNQRENGIYVYEYCNDPINIVREIIDNLNNRKIVNFNSDLMEVKIYASKENIDKLKSNQNMYMEKICKK